ncbi:hypothetical protein D3C80_1851840 [compost metagenome]
MVGDIAGGKHAVDFGGGGIAFATALHPQVAVMHLQLALEQVRIGFVANGDEHARQR